MGMRPAMALMPLDREVQKAPVIQRAALHCIFFNLVMFLTIGAPLKNQAETCTGQWAECRSYTIGIFG